MHTKDTFFRRIPGLVAAVEQIGTRVVNGKFPREKLTVLQQLVRCPEGFATQSRDSAESSLPTLRRGQARSCHLHDADTVAILVAVM